MSYKITQNYLSLTPAYGRDYKSAKETVEAFRSGKDFNAHSHLGTGYTSIRDFAVGVTVNIRYNRLQRVAVYQVKAADHKPKTEQVT